MNPVKKKVKSSSASSNNTSSDDHYYPLMTNVNQGWKKNYIPRSNNHIQKEIVYRLLHLLVVVFFLVDLIIFFSLSTFFSNAVTTVTTTTTIMVMHGFIYGPLSIYHSSGPLHLILFWPETKQNKKKIISEWMNHTSDFTIHYLIVF